MDSTDCELIRGWRNDYRVWKWCRQNDLISDVEQKAWYQRQSADPAIKMYKITALEDGNSRFSSPIAVGVCGLTDIDMTNRSAEFSLYIAPGCQGSNLGEMGLRLLLTHGFKNLGLKTIWGESFAGNPALKMFERLGFFPEGLRRGLYFRDGDWIDAHIFSMKDTEWNPIT